MDILFLCTGNICRSPMAEALLRERLDGRGVPAVVSSAGLLYEDAPPSEGSVVALAERALDISGHRSRIMQPDALRAADLVLGMARMHVREAVVAAPDRFPRIFTLKELVRRAELVGPRTGESFDTWLGRVGDGRRTVDLLGEDPIDDVADPIGHPLPVYRRTAEELSDLVDRLVAMAWAPAASGAGRS